MNTNLSIASDKARAHTVLFIHGLFLTARSWENWVAHYEGLGYNVLAPGWPGMEAGVEELNRDPSPIAKLDVTAITDHYHRIIHQMEKPPILIGHSLGGAIVQLLLGRGLGVVGIGVASGPVKGVADLPLSTIWSSLPVLGNPFNPGKATPLSPEQFHYAFTNTLTREESDIIYKRHHVPCANRVLFELAFANFHKDSPIQVDFKKADRAPLLLISSEQDHIVPPGVSRHNAELYGESTAITEFHEFLGRPHFPAVPGWEEIADFTLDWAIHHIETP